MGSQSVKYRYLTTILTTKIEKLTPLPLKMTHCVRKDKKMRGSRNTCAVKTCDICGDGGWPEQMATCYQCKSAQEHIYCMKFLLCQCPKVWFCEECRSCKGQIFPRNIAQELCPGALSSTISREDLRQSLGGPNVKLTSLSDLRSNPVCQTDTLITKSYGTPRFETSLTKFSPQEVNVVPDVRAVSDCNPLVLGNEEIHPMTQQQVPQTSKELKGNNWLTCKEETVETLETLGIRVKKEAEITHSPSIDALPIISSGDVLFADVQPQSFAEDEPFNSFSLNSRSIWCGSIEMLSLDSSKFYDGFWAYLPCTVHPKVLEFSKQMPGVISCSSVPCCNISLKVFQNDTPNIDDIALIFSPGNFQRSREQYDSLLELIEMQDLLLKCCINGVELLIFSSKSLDADSSGFKLGSFLCGVYKNVKGNLGAPLPPLLTHEVISEARADSSSARSKIKQSFSEVKTEPYYQYHPDVPPGFPRRAADADAWRRNQLSHI